MLRSWHYALSRGEIRGGTLTRLASLASLLVAGRDGKAVRAFNAALSKPEHVSANERQGMHNVHNMRQRMDRQSTHAFDRKNADLHNFAMQPNYPAILQALKLAHKTGQAGLAKILKVEQSTISRTMRNESAPTHAFHERLMAEARRFGLVTEDGDLIRDVTHPRDRKKTASTKSEEDRLTRGEVALDAVSTIEPYRAQLPNGMPDIDVSAGAGPGGLALPRVTASNGIIYSGEAVRGEISMPRYLIGEFTRAEPSRVHWIRVRGDSMSGTLEAGDRVGVDTTDTGIGQGGIFVFCDHDGEVLVKRLKRVIGSEPPMIEIISDNPKQGSDTVSAEMITVIGRVVARVSRVG
jgi:SOS-response transcriptional repressor LexA